MNLVFVDALNPAWIVSPLTSTVKIQTINTEEGDAIIDEVLTGI